MSKRIRFGAWCKQDPEDTTKIVYTFRTKDNKTMYFTSDDTVSFSLIHRLRNAWVESVKRVHNEFEDCWNVVLYE